MGVESTKILWDFIPTISLRDSPPRSGLRAWANQEEGDMASAKREMLDNIPLIVVAAMAVLGLLSFFSVILS